MPTYDRLQFFVQQNCVEVTVVVSGRKPLLVQKVNILQYTAKLREITKIMRIHPAKTLFLHG
jgi:hypothetical protein